MNRTIRIDNIPRTQAYRIAAALAALTLIGFTAAPICKAVSPPPDGGYSGQNTAEGTSALFSLTTGTNNTALGFQALFSDTTGDFNTATGVRALRFNTANDNTATGWQALYKNTTGTPNTAVGRSALELNTTGQNNTAVGFQALRVNTEAENTAVGHQAGASNTTGATMCAVGAFALFSNNTGNANNAVGDIALFDNTTGSFNNAFGVNALGHSTGSSNTAVGDGAGASLGTGDGNVYVGAGVVGVDGDNNTTRIRNIGATAQDTGIFVTLNAVGGDKLGHVNLTSSRRFKEEIKPMDKASEALFALKPVSFRYKKEFDQSQAERFGLVAEEVEKVNRDLVARNDRGELTTVRYEAVNAMLLNEFLKEHRKVEQLETTIAKQQKQIDALTEDLQKVSDQLELSKPAPRVVGNNH
jgi:hypothetical protein